MCHASCMSMPQTTGKPIGMRGHCSLLTFPQPHLKTLVRTEVGSGLHFGLCGFSWHPPSNTNNCDMWMMMACDKGHMQHFAALSKPSALGHQQKGAGSPVEVVLIEEWAALPGFSRILKHVQWLAHVANTHGNTSKTVEGSRLQSWGCTRCVALSDPAAQMSWVREPEPPKWICSPF